MGRVADRRELSRARSHSRTETVSDSLCDSVRGGACAGGGTDAPPGHLLEVAMWGVT